MAARVDDRLVLAGFPRGFREGRDPVAPHDDGQRRNEDRVAGQQKAVVHEAGRQRAEHADRGGHAQDAPREFEVDEPAAVVADEARQEAERLRDQCGADRRDRRVQDIFRAQQREDENEDRRKQGRATNTAQHRQRRDDDRGGEHEPVECEVHFVDYGWIAAMEVGL